MHAEFSLSPATTLFFDTNDCSIRVGWHPFSSVGGRGGIHFSEPTTKSRNCSDGTIKNPHQEDTLSKIYSHLHIEFKSLVIFFNLNCMSHRRVHKIGRDYPGNRSDSFTTSLCYWLLVSLGSVGRAASRII